MYTSALSHVEDFFNQLHLGTTIFEYNDSAQSYCQKLRQYH